MPLLFHLFKGKLDNGFERELVKDQKIFLAKASNLKRNAAKEPNVVFLAMTIVAASDPQYLDKIHKKVLLQFNSRGTTILEFR